MEETARQMPRSRARIHVLVPVLIVASLLGATACGSSSSPSSSSSAPTTTAAVSTLTRAITTTTRSLSPAEAAAYSGKLNTYAACMRGQGVNVPPAKTGVGGLPSLAAPSGASREQVLHAMRRCRTFLVAALEAHSKVTH